MLTINLFLGKCQSDIIRRAICEVQSLHSPALTDRKLALRWFIFSKSKFKDHAEFISMFLITKPFYFIFPNGSRELKNHIKFACGPHYFKPLLLHMFLFFIFYFLFFIFQFYYFSFYFLSFLCKYIWGLSLARKMTITSSFLLIIRFSGTENLKI